jgi:hypothetical protein
MDEIPKPVVKPLWFAIPITLHAEMVRAGMDAATRDLNIGAWSFVGMHQTDGQLTVLEASHLYSSSRVRRKSLVEAGFWREMGKGFELVGYLEVNSTRVQIDEKRAGHRARQAKYEKKLSDERQPQESPDPVGKGAPLDD